MLIRESQCLIVGYGNIGQKVAMQVKGFGAVVTGVKSNLTSPITWY
jgi:lactate dehydrogenase-like 2-hydroxyacid dehydrogenase